MYVDLFMRNENVRLGVDIVPFEKNKYEYEGNLSHIYDSALSIVYFIIEFLFQISMLNTDLLNSGGREKRQTFSVIRII